ncbi:tyrosine-type recombinase/integrase [Paenibacillus sp. SI8]|uniref:tyrosine-type recombinase/integrase n=1 Tax=unclassified Paenibacillus TaxID=185978 RepID=UPI003466ABC5
MVLLEAIGQFEKYQTSIDRSEKTIEAYRNDLLFFVKYLVDAYNCTPYLTDVTSEDIEDYFFYLKKERGYSPASLKRKLAVFRTFYNFCNKKKYCNTNAAVHVETIKQEHREKEFLTSGEVLQLVDAIDHQLMKKVVLTLYYTGLRISECINLTLEEIDFKHNTIKIYGKGKKERIVPLNLKLKEILLHYIENERPYSKTNNLFCTAASGGVSDSYVNKLIKTAVDKLGWNKEVTCHTFRHSFASNLVKKNVNVVQIQKLLGHTSLSTTTVYTHTKLDDLTSAVNQL